MVGVFDSGFGGLTILKEFLRQLPEYDYIYLGDNARTPYGSKSQKVIYNHTRQAVDFLFNRSCELIIIACNTASAEALKKIQHEYLLKYHPDKKIFGVIIPVVEDVVKETRFGRVGIIGTRSTIESGKYEIELNKLRDDLEVYAQSCPLLAPLVEEGWAGKPETKKIIRKYLRPLKEKRIDILILGCTHYQILTKDIKSIMGRQVKVLNSPEIVAKKLENYLKRHPEIERKLGKNKKRLFLTTGNQDRFKNMGKKFLGENVGQAEKIEL